MVTVKRDEAMILVMGVTGAGKSYFINQLAGKKLVQEGPDLESCKHPHTPRAITFQFDQAHRNAKWFQRLLAAAKCS